MVNGKIIPIMFCALCEEGTKDSALITYQYVTNRYVMLKYFGNAVNYQQW